MPNTRTDDLLPSHPGEPYNFPLSPPRVEEKDLQGSVPVGVIDKSKFAAGLTPIEIVGALPGLPNSNYPQGSVVFLTTDNKLYRSTGAVWSVAVPTVDLTGQITTAQITNLAVDSTKLADLAVTTAKLNDLAVSTAKIAALAVDNGQLAALAVTNAKIADTTITAGKLVAHTITANEIAALTITAAEIAAGTITGAKIAATTITAANIAALTITANEIAAGAITTSKLAAGSVVAGIVAANTITAYEIAAGTITAYNIRAGTITANEIAAGTITADNIAAGTITAAQIAASTILTNNLNITVPNYPVGLGNAWAVFRGPNVAHGMTSRVPTDVAGLIFPVSSFDGGMVLSGFTETVTAIELDGSATTPTTLDNVSSGVVRLVAVKKSGTTTADLAAADNAFSIYTGGIEILLKGDGRWLLPLASASTPAYSFLGDANTGVYSPAADEYAIATNGIQRAHWTNTLIELKNKVSAYIGGSTTLGTVITFVGQLSNQTRTANTTASMGGGITLPAGALATNGDSVTVEVRGHLAVSSTAAITLQIKFGATLVCVMTITAAQALTFDLSATITRTGATTQLARGLAIVGQNGVNIANATIRGDNTAPAETLANAILIDIQGQSDGTRILTLDSAIVTTRTA